jgi:hypothetical protein
MHQTKHGLNLAGNISVRGDSLAQLLGGRGAAYIPNQAFSLHGRLRMSPAAIRFDALRFTGQHMKIGETLGFTGKDYSRIEFDLVGSRRPEAPANPGPQMISNA